LKRKYSIYFGGRLVSKVQGNDKAERKRREVEMQWEIIVALVIAVPVILFPAAFVWYCNIGGLMKLFQTRKARAAKKEAVEVVSH
jgi:hypothetical protein